MMKDGPDQKCSRYVFQDSNLGGSSRDVTPFPTSFSMYLELYLICKVLSLINAKPYVVHVTPMHGQFYHIGWFKKHGYIDFDVFPY